MRENLRQEIFKMIQLVLNKETKDIWGEFRESIVEHALFTNYPNYLKNEEIVNIVQTEFNLNFTEKEIDDKLVSLREKSRVTFKDNTWKLADNVRNKIDNKITQNKKIFDDLCENFISRINDDKRKHFEKNKDSAKQILQTFVTIVLAKISIPALQNLVSIEAASKFARNHDLDQEKPSFEQAMENCQVPYDMRQDLEHALKETVSTQNYCNFFFDMVQRYIPYITLRADPSSQVLSNEFFKGTNFFLDTNFIMDLFLETRTRQKIAKAASMLSRNLGARLWITRFTKEEFMNNLSDADNLFRSSSEPDLRESSTFNAFLRDFFAIRDSGKKMNWENYLHQTRKTFEKSFNDYQLNLYEQDHKSIYNNPNFSHLSATLSDISSQMKNYRKSKFHAEHDAYHLLLINELREQTIAIKDQQKYWFVTQDNVLYPASKTIVSSDSTPLSIKGDVLFNIVSLYAPFFNKKTSQNTVEAFISFCQLPFVHSFREIDPSKIQKAIEPVLEDFDKSEVDYLWELLNERTIKHMVVDPQEQELSKKHPQSEKIVYDRLADRVNELEGRLRSLNDSLQTEVQKTHTQEATNKELSKSNVKLKYFVLALSLVCFVVLSLFIYGKLLISEQKLDWLFWAIFAIVVGLITWLLGPIKDIIRWVNNKKNK
jgi:hypothetical protein